MSVERWALPYGWAWAKVSDIAQIVGGATPSSRDESNFTEHGISWITPADLTGYEHPYISKGRRDLSVRGYLSCGARLMPKGTVLFSSRAPIGYCAIAEQELCTNQGFKSLVLREGLIPEFVRYYLLSAKDYAESLASGTTFLELSGSRLGAMHIPIAPMVDQRTVVAKLDFQFERISRALAQLSAVQPLLKRYRAKLLQAAFDGSLIDCQPTNHQPLSEVVDSLIYGTSKKSHVEPSGTTVLRIPNVSAGEISLSDIKYSKLDEREYERLRLNTGDLLVVRSNGSPELVGRPAVVGDEAAGMAFAGYLIRIRPKATAVDSRYLSYMMQSPQSRAKIEAKLTSTSGVHNVNAKQLAELLIPDISLEQQARVVNKLDQSNAWIARVENECKAAMEKLVELRRRILATAFRGDGDESAESLVQAKALLEKVCLGALPELPVPNLSMDVEESMSEDPQTKLLRDSEDWPPEGLAFEEVARRVVLERDQMRDAVFSLLGGDTPEFVQVFNPSSGRIFLKRSSR